MSSIALILAAGKGTRMNSSLPKPIVGFKSVPMARHIIGAFFSAGIKDVHLVVGYGAEQVKNAIGEVVGYVLQKEQKGTANAVEEARNKIDWKGKDVFVFVGDAPLIKSNTIQELLSHHKKTNAVCTFLTADFAMKLPYARIIKDENGKLLRCVEEKDASEAEKEIKELLSSHFVFKGDFLFDYLSRIKPDAKNGEYYLTDIINLFINDGLKTEVLSIPHYEELVGLNTPEDLAWAENFSKKHE